MIHKQSKAKQSKVLPKYPKVSAYPP